MYAKQLAFILNPAGVTDQTASLDPVYRMVKEGKWVDAFTLTLFAVDAAWITISCIAGFVILTSCLGFNGAKGADTLFGALGLPIIVLWVCITCRNSKRWYITAIGFALTGLLGWICFHAQALTGGEYQLSPLLAGLFGLPIAITAWHEAPTGPIPDAHPIDIRFERSYAILGAFAGCMTGFLAGLGSGSLVAMAGEITNTDEDYVLMSSAGNTTNELMALLLMLAAGMGRSGEAVLMGRTLQNPEPGALIAIGLALAFGALVSRKCMLLIKDSYVIMVRRINKKALLVAIVSLSLVPVMLAGGLTINGQLTVWCLLGAGVLLAKWLRNQHLPNQVAFGALALPILVQGMNLF